MAPAVHFKISIDDSNQYYINIFNITPGKINFKIYDRHLQANVGQCKNGDDEHKGLAFESLSPSHGVWQGGCNEPLLKSIMCWCTEKEERKKETNSVKIKRPCFALA